MNIKTDRFVVVDLEATCWDDNRMKQSEIIEIGICVVNLSSEKIENAESFIVLPDNLDISPFCTELTGHTKEFISTNGRPLHERINTMRREYPLASCAWGSWGDYDRHMLINECRRKGIEYPFRDTHINLKHLHAMMHRHRRGLGMEAALKNAGMELIGRHHSGKDDAVNTARIVLELFKPR